MSHHGVLVAISMLATSPQSLRSMALSTRALCPDPRQQMRVRTRFRRVITEYGWVVSMLPNDMRDGYYAELEYGNKICRSRAYYINGIKQGTLLRWYYTGVLAERSACVDHVMEGMCETWYYEGMRREVCFHKCGRLFGDYKRWAPNGELKKHLVYDHMNVSTVIYWSGS